MQTENYIIAIDLGTYQSRIVAGYPDETRPYGLNIVYAESQRSQGIKRGAVYNKEDANKVVRNLITGAEKKVNVGSKRKTSAATQPQRTVCVNIGGYNFLTTIIGEKIDLNDQKVTQGTLKLIEDKARSNQQQYSEEDSVTRLVSLGYSIDNEPFTDDVIGRSGSMFEARFLCFKSKRKTLELINSAFPPNSQPKIYYTSTFARAAVELQPTLKRDGVVFVDLGSGSTGVAVFHRDALRYEVEIPIGSDTITNDIASALSITTSNAEFVKQRLGIIDDAMSRRDFEVEMPDDNKITFDGSFYNFVVKARVEELTAYIVTAIGEAVKRGCRKQDLRIVLTGGGAQLKNIGTIIKEKTEMEVVEVQRPEIAPDIDSVSFAAAVGMASMTARALLSEIHTSQLPIDEPQTADNEPEQPAEEPVAEEETATTKTKTKKRHWYDPLRGFAADLFNDDK